MNLDLAGTAAVVTAVGTLIAPGIAALSRSSRLKKLAGLSKQVDPVSSSMIKASTSAIAARNTAVDIIGGYSMLLAISLLALLGSVLSPFILRAVKTVLKPAVDGTGIAETLSLTLFAFAVFAGGLAIMQSIRLNDFSSALSKAVFGVSGSDDRTYSLTLKSEREGGIKWWWMLIAAALVVLLMGVFLPAGAMPCWTVLAKVGACVISPVAVVIALSWSLPKFAPVISPSASPSGADG